VTILDLFRLDGHVALVNGGGRGIGAACAVALAEAGADVAIRAKEPIEIEQTAQRLRAIGHRVVAVEAGEGPEDERRAIEAVVAELGPITTLLNVAGGAGSGAFMDITDDQLAAAFDFNVALPLRLSRLVVPHMLEAGGGSIVNISTAMAHLVARGFVTYGTVKAALQHATRLMAADLSPRIRVNAVAPGAVLTDGLRAFIQRIGESGVDPLAAVPMRRLGEPQDVAAAALFLCSPAASYVTGTVLEVDGGMQQPAFAIAIPDL
jgi:7-alpha-hydroxysteroid dehydrogenase